MPDLVLERDRIVEKFQTKNKKKINKEKEFNKKKMIDGQRLHRIIKRIEKKKFMKDYNKGMRFQNSRNVSKDSTKWQSVNVLIDHRSVILLSCNSVQMLIGSKTTKKND